MALLEQGFKLTLDIEPGEIYPKYNAWQVIIHGSGEKAK